jgi:hypothetical protein
VSDVVFEIVVVVMDEALEVDVIVFVVVAAELVVTPVVTGPQL